MKNLNWFLSGLLHLVLLGVLFHFLSISPAFSNITLEPNPSWITTNQQCGTGAAITDYNQDGFFDLAISSGNDIVAESENIFFGSAAGLQITPAWTSDDSTYSGHCAAGDLNGDGYPELIVANYIDSTSGFTETVSKIYYGSPQGMEAMPSWYTPNLRNSFRVALGDVDGDGDLDLATANGEAYNERPQPNEIFINQNGILQDEPEWISDDLDSSYDLSFADFDRDGDLDLAVANSAAPTKLYINDHYSFSPKASWSSDDSDNDNSLAWGDLNADGWPDLAVITNSQLQSGKGNIKIYMNNSGVLPVSPSYRIELEGQGYGSAVHWTDLDGDGDQDLSSGSWWGNVTVYENDGSNLLTPPIWRSDNSFVVESIVSYPPSTGPLDQYRDIFRGNNQKQLFLLDQFPIISLNSVMIDGVILASDQYCYQNETGWISLMESPPNNSRIVIEYSVAPPNLLIATSWGDQSAIGSSYGYKNLSSSDSVKFRSLDLLINMNEFSGKDRFELACEIRNPLSTFIADFYLLLEIDEQFYFYPTWSRDLDFQTVEISAQSVDEIEILDFVFPNAIIGLEDNINIYSALFLKDTYELICDFDFESIFLH